MRFDDESETESQQQPVERVELAQVLQKQAFDQNPGGADDDGRDDERSPIIDAEILQQQVSGERAHHVLRTVREVDDVEHAENDGEPKAQQSVE